MTSAAPARRSIDLNADLGEWDAASPGADPAHRADLRLMERVTSVNVACGGHCGDLGSMQATVRAALARGLAIGAHPSLPDREGFGRRALPLPPATLGHAVAGQVAALAAVAAAAGTRLRHVKPHGALYDLASRDARVAERVVRAVADVDPRLVLVGLSGGELPAVAARHGIACVAEVFCDRGYDEDGFLVPRGAPGALVADPDVAAARLVRMVREGRVTARGGADIAVVADTACIHGDTPGAAEVAGRIHAALAAAGIAVAAFTGPA